MRAALRLLIVAAVLSAVGCGGDKTVDTASIESGIKQQIVVPGTEVSSVSCPEDVTSQKGASFSCNVKFENGATGKVKVTQTGANHFTYELVSGSLHVPASAVEPEIEQALTQQGVNDPSVNCPDDIIVKVGTYVVCDVTSASGRTGSVKFTWSSSSGEVDTSSVDQTS